MTSAGGNLEEDQAPMGGAALLMAAKVKEDGTGREGGEQKRGEEELKLGLRDNNGNKNRINQTVR